MGKYISNQELDDIARDIVSKAKHHKDYDRTIEVAKWCRETMTGKQSKEVVWSYRTKETDAQKEQRLRLYNSRTQEVGYKVQKMFNEVHRSDTITDEVSYPETNSTDQTELETAVNAFDPENDQDLKEWLADKYRHLQFHDPNAWIVMEREVLDNLLARTGEPKQITTVWPIIVEAKHAWNWEVINGEIQWFCSRTMRKYQKKATAQGPQPTGKSKEGRFVMGEIYTFWGIGYGIKIRVIPPEAEFELEAGETQEAWMLNRDDQLKPYTVLVTTYDNELKQHQARRVGYFPDPETTQRTFVSPLYPAEKIIEDLVRRKMAYDLSHALHGFFKQFIYVEKCQQCNGTGKIDVKPRRGQDGERYTQKATCKQCDGQGKIRHSGEQDIVEMNLPSDIQQIVPLRDLIHYAEIPAALFDKQREDYEQAKEDCYAAIFSEHQFTRGEVVTTATESNLNWRSVYNALQDYASRFSTVYTWAIYRIAELKTLPIDSLSVNHSISSDFRLETVEQLLDQRKKALDSKAPMEVIEGIDAKVLSQQHKSDPNFLAKQQAKEQLRPMRGKTQEEQMMALGTLANQGHPLYVVWLYFEDIMQDLAQADDSWWELDYPAMKQAFDEIAAAYIAREEAFSDGQMIGLDEALTEARKQGANGGAPGDAGGAPAEESTEGEPGTIQSEGEGGAAPPAPDTGS